jgi:redox-sensitive bicupin YhaK (pirin superfamily)
MIDVLIPERRRDLGGFEVGRVLPFARRRMVGPFIFFDHMGPRTLEKGLPRSVDVRPHPHIGLATVTYLLDGEIMHRDSVGSVQAIEPGAVNWMTAGRGITHSERFERARAQGDFLEGIQAWVALPEALEETAPAFAHHSAEVLPGWSEAGVEGRLIAGEAFGLRSPVATLSPLFYAHLKMAPQARTALPAGLGERAVYVARGVVEIAGQSVAAGQMAVLGGSDTVPIKAQEAAIVFALGGAPLGERYVEWNFVSASRARIEQAKADWRAGRMKLPDFDQDEYIPLPPEA